MWWCLIDRRIKWLKTVVISGPSRRPKTCANHNQAIDLNGCIIMSDNVWWSVTTLFKPFWQIDGGDNVTMMTGHQHIWISMPIDGVRGRYRKRISPSQSTVVLSRPTQSSSLIPSSITFLFRTETDNFTSYRTHSKRKKRNQPTKPVESTTSFDSFSVRGPCVPFQKKRSRLVFSMKIFFQLGGRQKNN